MSLTQARLKELLHYAPETGEFTWRSSGTGRKPDRPAGCIDNRGRRRITIDGKRYLAARLAFLYVAGAFPSGQADHINRHPDDDRWENLRPATGQMNARNRKPRGGKSPYKGVNLCRRKWQAVCDREYLGQFDRQEDAARAYDAAAAENYGKFAYLNFPDE